MVYRYHLHVCALSSGLLMILKCTYVYIDCVCVCGGGGTGNQQVMITGEDIQITLSKCLEIMSIHCLRCLF